MMFCPNCRMERSKDTEYCSKCGVKLENRINSLDQRNIKCPYCGRISKLLECEHCGRLIEGSNPTSSIMGYIYAVQKIFKNLKYDDTFVKTNLVIIVGIMGVVVILMLL